MRTLTLAALLAFFTAPALAGQIRVVCDLKQSGTFLKIMQAEDAPAEVRLFVNGELQAQIASADVFELYQGLYRLNVVAAHHNSVIKISADYDLFGGDLSREGGEIWNGWVFLSENLAAYFGGVSLHQTSCNYDT